MTVISRDSSALSGGEKVQILDPFFNVVPIVHADWLKQESQGFKVTFFGPGNSKNGVSVETKTAEEGFEEDH